MRRSIAAVLLSSSLILVAAGCEVTAAQKQAAARVLTSAILNSVLLIESRGHHADDPAASVDIAKSRSAKHPSESAAGETTRAASLISAEPGDRVSAADGLAQRETSPLENADAGTEHLLESPHVIRVGAINAVAGGLTPSTLVLSPEASTFPVQAGTRVPVIRRLKVNPLTACLQSAVTATPASTATATTTATTTATAIRHLACSAVVCKLTKADAAALKKFEKQLKDCPLVKARIPGRFNKNRRLVVINRDARIDSQKLSTMVRNSLCFVTTAAPSH